MVENNDRKKTQLYINGSVTLCCETSFFLDFLKQHDKCS